MSILWCQILKQFHSRTMGTKNTLYSPLYQLEKEKISLTWWLHRLETESSDKSTWRSGVKVHHHLEDKRSRCGSEGLFRSRWLLSLSKKNEEKIRGRPTTLNIYHMILPSRDLSLFLNIWIAFLTMVPGAITPELSTKKWNLSFFFTQLVNYLLIRMGFGSSGVSIFLHSSQKIQFPGRATSNTPALYSKTFVGQLSLMALFVLSDNLLNFSSSNLTSGSGLNVAIVVGDHFACIFPIPLCTSNVMLIDWFWDSLTMGIPRACSSCNYDLNTIGLTCLDSS